MAECKPSFTSTRLASMFYSILCVLLLIEASKPEGLVIEDSGLANFGPNDNAIIFFIQILETGPSSSRIHVEATECCETLSSEETDCGTIRPIGGDMGIEGCGKPRNLTLFFPTLYAYNRHGSCLIDIRLEGSAEETRHRIEFDTVIRRGEQPGDGEEIEPCATLDLDPYDNCRPVACAAKYNGLRNYFDPRKQLCVKAVVCEENEIILAGSNTCRKRPTVSSADLSEIGQKIRMREEENAEIICQHGEIRNGACVCEPGWETIREDDSSVSALNFCNVPCAQPTTQEADPTDPYILFWSILLASLIVLVVCVWNRFYEKQSRHLSGDPFFFRPINSRSET